MCRQGIRRSRIISDRRHHPPDHRRDLPDLFHQFDKLLGVEGLNAIGHRPVGIVVNFNDQSIRAHGVAAGVPAAALSRGVAGTAGSTLIVNLPGSTGGVRDGMAVLGGLLGHAVDQIRGGDLPRPGGTG